MRAVVLVAGAEMRRRIRNRSALFTAFVGPLVLAVVFGLLLGGTDSAAFTVGVVDLDRSEVTAGFTTGLVAAGEEPDQPLAVELLADEQAARDALDVGDVDAVLVLPAGLGDAVMNGQGGDLTVLRDPAQPIAGEIARSIASRFAGGVSTRTLAAATIVGLGAPLPDSTALAGLDESIDRITDRAAGGTPLDGTAYFGVSMSILFLFFTVSFVASSIAAERANGVLDRMLATDAAPWAIVAGKVLAVCGLGLAGFATVWGVTSLAFGATWGNPLAVVLTMVATVLAVGGVAMFVSGFARTPAQAEAYTSMVAFALALLGGNFIGPGTAPDLLERLSLFTPNGQSLQAFTAIAVDDATVGGVLGRLAVLVAFGLVFGGIGMLRARRAVTR